MGVELGYLSSQYKALGIETNAFVELMATIPYRLYPLLAIFTALMVCRRASGMANDQMPARWGSCLS